MPGTHSSGGVRSENASRRRTANSIFTFRGAVGEDREYLHPGTLQELVQVQDVLGAVIRGSITGDLWELLPDQLGELALPGGDLLDRLVQGKPRDREVSASRVDFETGLLVGRLQLRCLDPNLDPGQRRRDLRVAVETLDDRARPR